MARRADRKSRLLVQRISAKVVVGVGDDLEALGRVRRRGGEGGGEEDEELEDPSHGLPLRN